MPEHTSSVKSFAVRASPLLVHLSESDLCSNISIGDVVNIVGQANYSSVHGKSDAKLLGDVQVLEITPSMLCERSGLSYSTSPDICGGLPAVVWACIAYEAAKDDCQTQNTQQAAAKLHWK